MDNENNSKSKENKFQINAFLQDNINFEIVDLKYSWDSIIKSKLWLGNEKYCQLLPNAILPIVFLKPAKENYP